MSSGRWGLSGEITGLKRRDRREFRIFLSAAEHRVRRQLSASQEESPHQNPTILAP